MHAVVDTNYFIHKILEEESISLAYIPSSVEQEIKDRLSREYLELYSFKIEIRDPQEVYVKTVQELCAGKHLGISNTDIDVVALTLELSELALSEWKGPGLDSTSTRICCLTRDNGIKAALHLLGIGADGTFQERRYRMRCYTCFTMYDEEMDFCQNCGYRTVTRVTVVGEGTEERVMLRKGYVPKHRSIRDSRGKEIKSSGQREYEQYKIEKIQEAKSLKRGFSGMF